MRGYFGIGPRGLRMPEGHCTFVSEGWYALPVWASENNGRDVIMRIYHAMLRFGELRPVIHVGTKHNRRFVVYLDQGET